MADDIARRREARRRKILENSEGRLKKLLGENVVNSDAGSVSTSMSLTPLTPDSLSSMGAFTPDSLIKLENSPKTENENDDTDIEDEAMSPRHLLRNIADEMVSRFEDKGYTKSEEISLVPHRRESFSTDRIQSPSMLLPKDILRKRESAKISAASTKYWFAQPSSRNGLLVILAVLVYLSIRADVEIIGKSIFLPFFVVEIGIISYERFFVPSTTRPALNTAHSLINGALILSGVPESLISRLTKVFLCVTRIWEELCLFLFTVLFLHWFTLD